MISRIISKTNEYISYRILIRDSFWFKKLRFWGVKKEQLEINPETRLIQFMGIELKRKEDLFLIEGKRFLLNLLKNHWKISRNSGQKVLTTNGDITFFVDTKQELFILNEIFLDNCYGYSIKEKSVVIDIGFNVGFASLFFANNPMVSKVIGFEPFEETYNQGLKNLSLNPALKDKIEVYNFGLAKEDKQLELAYEYDNKGSISTVDSLNDSSGTKKSILLKDVIATFEELKVLEKKEQIIIKMDCEGGEYEIMEALETNGLLGKIKCIMLEWHKLGSNDLIGALERFDFQIFEFRQSSELGLIYAVRR